MLHRYYLARVGLISLSTMWQNAGRLPGIVPLCVCAYMGSCGLYHGQQEQ